MSEFPALEASLLRAAHRRYGWRRWRPRVAIALVAAAAAGVTLLLAARPQPVEREHTATPRWERYSVPRYGVDVSLPPGWHLAAQTLTPRLLDPREIVSATTFAPGAPIAGCAMFPAAAIRRMGPTDALVSVQERGRGSPRGVQRLMPDTPRLNLADCVGAFGGSLTWTDLGHGPRNLTALVAFGAGASRTVRGDAYAILDRMRFDPGYVPSWSFGG